MQGSPAPRSRWRVVRPSVEPERDAATALALEPLAGGLAPIKPITADLDLEPGTDEPTVWRDGRWRVRWPRTVDELLAVIDQ